MKRAGTSLMLQGQRKSLNAWREMAEAAATKKQGMMRVVASIRMRGTRQAWNAWAEMAAELAAAKRQAAGALRSFSPEGRKQRAAWNSWVELAQERALMKRAATSLFLQSSRRCLNAWREMVEEMAWQRTQLKSLCPENIKMRMALNTWAVLLDDALARKADLARTCAAALISGGLQPALSNAPCKAPCNATM